MCVGRTWIPQLHIYFHLVCLHNIIIIVSFHSQLFQDFVRKSNMAPFSPADYSGYWRYLTVRHSNHTGDIMLIVVIHPQVILAYYSQRLRRRICNFTASLQYSVASASDVCNYFYCVSRISRNNQTFPQIFYVLAC